MPHHGEASVVARNRGYETRTFRERCQCLHLAYASGQLLVADHVDAGFEIGAGHRRMHVVRTDNHHRLDVVGPGSLPRDNLMEIALGTVGVEAKIGP
jgi:hypothetical protein